VVRESVTEEGRKLRQGFFLTKQAGDKFAERGRAKGAEVTAREVPREIVIEAEYKITLPFVASLEARKVAAKIALTAIALQYGKDLALTSQFDPLRNASLAKALKDTRVWFFANEGFIGAHVRTAHQHSVMCYLSAGMRKGWSLVTLFGGITYIVGVTTDYAERFNPIVLADEMTLIGHVLSPATTFEDLEKIDDQWFPIMSEFCRQKGIVVERLGRADAGTAAS